MAKYIHPTLIVFLSLGFLLGCSIDLKATSQFATQGGPIAADPSIPEFRGDLSYQYSSITDDDPDLDAIGKLHQKAAEITARAHFEVMKMIKPGLTEGDLKKKITETFNSMGASGLAFSHIVGSGPNSTDIHYSGSSRVLREGDVVVVDIGAKYQGYCADLTRTYPVTGEYSDRQREIYQLVLDAQTATTEYITPGKTTMNSLTSYVRAFFKASPLRAKDKYGNLRTMDYFFTHGLGHYLGKQVHAPGNYYFPIPMGKIFTIEPGLYVESEDIGVRIEDDYVLSSKGAQNIWSSLPSEADAVEIIIQGSVPWINGLSFH